MYMVMVYKYQYNEYELSLSQQFTRQGLGTWDIICSSYLDQFYMITKSYRVGFGYVLVKIYSGKVGQLSYYTPKTWENYENVHIKYLFC